MKPPAKLLRPEPSALSSTTRGSRCSRPLWASRHSQRGPSKAVKPLTTLQEANPHNLPEVWFNATFPMSNIPPSSGPDRRRDVDDNERNVKLGKTLRILQDRLPTLLQSPLPQEILAPNITLHLFPSTHPHLPAVSGRVAYLAAIWTSPIAWNRMPIIGNVKLEILSERMSKEPLSFSPRRSGAVGEQLIVRWRTIGKPMTLGFNLSRIGASVKAPSISQDKDFTGLFLFDFDKDGKIISHTIETVEAGGNWERGVGAKVVGLTDWLLGGIRGTPQGTACLAACHAAGTRRDREL